MQPEMKEWLEHLERLMFDVMDVAARTCHTTGDITTLVKLCAAKQRYDRSMENL